MHHKRAEFKEVATRKVGGEWEGVTITEAPVDWRRGGDGGEGGDPVPPSKNRMGMARDVTSCCDVRT
jgi:hypothetical protein